jgi:hypothetical protein
VPSPSRPTSSPLLCILCRLAASPPAATRRGPTSHRSTISPGDLRPVPRSARQDFYPVFWPLGCRLSRVGVTLVLFSLEISGLGLGALATHTHPNTPYTRSLFCQEGQTASPANLATRHSGAKDRQPVADYSSPVSRLLVFGRRTVLSASQSIRPLLFKISRWPASPKSSLHHSRQPN